MARLLIFLFILSSKLFAIDCGTYGTTYPIQEQDITECLREKLLHANKNELNLFMKKQIQRISEPKAIHLPNATNHRCHFYDPTLVVNTDIKDSEGNIIDKRGTRYNPLETVDLTNNLLFFDATQSTHIEWAKANEGLWVLTKGKPIDLEDQEERVVYFDQFGYLTKKLGITAIPARVSQEGLRLKIEEIQLETSS